MGDQPRHALHRISMAQKDGKTLLCAGYDVHPLAPEELSSRDKRKVNMQIYGFRNGGDIDVKSEAFETYSQAARLASVPQDMVTSFAGLLAAIEDYLHFHLEILVSKGNVRVIKPQFGFYVQFGLAGMLLLQRLRFKLVALRQQYGISIEDILDCKPGDIATTQQAYMTGFMGNLKDQWGIDYAPFDFSVINPTPWMGEDVLALEDKEGKPMAGLKLLREGKGLIYVNKTSNPSGKQYQDLLVKVGDEKMALYLVNAMDANDLSMLYGLETSGVSQLGLVVGATRNCDGTIRKVFPTTTLLNPGFGEQSQGKDPLSPFRKVMLELRRDGRHNGLGCIFSSSRGLLFPWMAKYGGSGRPETLEEDLLGAIAVHRALEEEAYTLPEVVDAGIINPFK